MITKPINVGKLNKRITLLQYTDTVDELRAGHTEVERGKNCVGYF